MNVNEEQVKEHQSKKHMDTAEKFNELNQLLTPLNQTWGEHGVTVTFFPGSEGGYMKFSLNWKTENLEVEFNNLDEATLKAKSIINQLEPSLQEVWNDWNSDDEGGDEEE